MIRDRGDIVVRVLSHNRAQQRQGVRMSKISEVRELAAIIEDKDHDVLDRVECVEMRQDAGLTPQLRRQQGRLEELTEGPGTS